MNSHLDLEKCFDFINCHLKPSSSAQFESSRKYRAITLSREAGAGGHSLAEKLAELLQATKPPPTRPWTIFDRNLVEEVLKDHNLPGRLAKYMPEDHISELTDIMDELFGLHPPSWTLVRKTSDTILRLAAVGNVIIIGRGGNVITSRLDHVFHVRLIGSFEQRVHRLQELSGAEHNAALRLARSEDLARRRYLKQFFGKDIDDPLLYHMIINTDRVTIEEAAQMIFSEITTVPLPLKDGEVRRVPAEAL